VARTESFDRLVLVGASAGGVSALMRLVSALPADYALPTLIVLHVGAHRSLLPELLARASGRAVSFAADGDSIGPGRIRVAPPDVHLMVRDGEICLHRGPKENLARPAIDPLFRSAARALGPRVVGVILTGRLDDGTAGLQEIKRHGGIAVVQDPSEATERGMPSSAVRYVDVDHVVSLDRMPALLASFAKRPDATASTPAPRSRRPDLAAVELKVAMGDPSGMQHLSEIGATSSLTCPECHGTLWKLPDVRPVRYRCHTGHAFTACTLHAALAESSDAAGWSALRALKERSALLREMAATEQCMGYDDRSRDLLSTAAHVERQAQVLQKLLHEGSAPID